jgi:hypothetical protein
VGEEAGGEWAARRNSARAGPTSTRTPSTRSAVAARGVTSHSATPHTVAGRTPPTARHSDATPHSGGSTLSDLPSPSDREAFRAELRAAAPRISHGLEDAQPPPFPTFPSSSARASTPAAASSARRHPPRPRPATATASSSKVSGWRDEFAELRQRKKDELQVYLDGREAAVNRAQGMAWQI